MGAKSFGGSNGKFLKPTPATVGKNGEKGGEAMFLIRFFGLVMLVLGSLVVLNDLNSIGWGEYEATTLAANYRLALWGGHGEWMAFAWWLLPAVIGALCLCAPRPRRLPRPPSA